MKFQITGPGYPCGAFVAPSGTIFDYDAPNMWTALVARGVIPLNATALDTEAWTAQQAAYPAYLLGPPPQ